MGMKYALIFAWTDGCMVEHSPETSLSVWCDLCCCSSRVTALSCQRALKSPSLASLSSADSVANLSC